MAEIIVSIGGVNDTILNDIDKEDLCRRINYMLTKKLKNYDSTIRVDVTLLTDIVDRGDVDDVINLQGRVLVWMKRCHNSMRKLIEID